MRADKMIDTHPFTDTIGPGPYRFLGTFDLGERLAAVSDGQMDTATAMSGAPRLEAGMGTCAHCGHGILHICIVRRGDGKLYGVGSDCILKVDCDTKLVSAVKLEKNRIAREKAAAKREAKRLARLQAERDANGGLTNYQLAEKRRQEREAAELAAKQPIIEALAPYAERLEDGKGGFCDSVARDLRNGNLPKGRGFEIMLDILAKQAGRANSTAYTVERENLEKFFEQTA